MDDQRVALAFYTDVLGFTAHREIPLGDDFCLTVVSHDAPAGTNCCWNRPATLRSGPPGTR